MPSVPHHGARSSVHDRSKGKRGSVVHEKQDSHIRLAPQEVKKEKINFDRIDVAKVRSCFGLLCSTDACAVRSARAMAGRWCCADALVAQVCFLPPPRRAGRPSGRARWVVQRA